MKEEEQISGNDRKLGLKHADEKCLPEGDGIGSWEARSGPQRSGLCWIWKLVSPNMYMITETRIDNDFLERVHKVRRGSRIETQGNSTFNERRRTMSQQMSTKWKQSQRWKENQDATSQSQGSPSKRDHVQS